MHPALLDAALQAARLAGPGDPAGASGGPEAGPGQVQMPFAWSGVSVYTGGASVLRVRLRQLPGAGVSLVAADSAGLAVLSVESLVSRPMPVQGAGPLDDLFAVEWVPIPVPVSAAGGPAPEVVHAGTGADAGAGAGPEPVPAEVSRVLEAVQRWLAGDRPAEARLAVVTRGAVSVAAGEGVADLAGAAVWGLIRSAQSENPGRLMLVDLPAGDKRRGRVAGGGSGPG